MRVKDQNGNVLSGLTKNSVGLVVDSTGDYEKYKRDRDSASEMKKLKEEIAEIKDMLIQLLNKQKE